MNEHYIINIQLKNSKGFNGMNKREKIGNLLFDKMLMSHNEELR